MKKITLTISIALTTQLLFNIPSSHAARKSCDNVCTAELTCDYFVTVYPDNEVAFNIGVQNSNDNLVELYCVYQSGLELPETPTVVGKNSESPNKKANNSTRITTDDSVTSEREHKESKTTDSDEKSLSKTTISLKE